MSTSFHLVDYAVLLGSLLISSFIGVFFAYKDRNQQNNTEFLLGSRQMGVGPVCLSLMASFLSAITVLGYPAEVYLRGASLSVSALSSVFATTCAGQLVVPVFYRLQLTSMHTYLEKRYHSTTLRKAVSGASSLSCIIYLGVQLYAPSVAIEATTGISVPLSMLSIGLICTFYTTIGGMKAVIWTDVIQMSLMFVALLVVLLKATVDTGGVVEVYRRTDEAGRLNLFDFRVDPFAAQSFWNCFFGMGVLWFAANGMSQQQIQRYCSLPTIEKARLAVYLNMIGVALTLSTAFLCGLAVYAYYHGCDPLQLGLVRTADQIMPYFVVDRFRIPGIPGLFVAAVFAGSLSTLSSGFNSMSACIWEDFVSPLLSPDIDAKRAAHLTKLIALISGGVTIGFGFMSAYVGNILQASLGVAAAIMGPACAVYLVGITLPFVNTTGASIGFVSSLAVCIWSVTGKLLQPPELPRLPTSSDFCNVNASGRAVSTVTAFTTVYYTKPLLDTIQPTGLQHLYYIHPYVMPAFGMVLTSLIAIVVSTFTGGNNHRKLEENLFSRTFFRLVTWSPPDSLNIFRWLRLTSPQTEIELKTSQPLEEGVPLKIPNISASN